MHTQHVLCNTGVARGGYVGTLLPGGTKILTLHLYREPVIAVARGNKKVEMAIGRRACDTAVRGMQVGTTARIALVVNGKGDPRPLVCGPRADE